MDLENKIALITGASRGIGAAAAKLFAMNGASVIINYIKAKEEAENLVAEIKNKQGKAMAFEADISNEAMVRTMFESIKKQYGRLDILINNAGTLINKPFAKRNLDDWNKVFAVNTAGIFLCSQAAAKIMLEHKSGAIINTASFRGLAECGAPDRIDYAASKAAVISITKTLAKELAPNIRVNAVAPGKVDTEMANYSRETIPDIIKTISLNRLIKPEEIADAYLFLASEKASAITGQVLAVDGGQSLN